MKGTFFQKPLEYTIDIRGESWTQGSRLMGSLNVKNHNDEDVDLSTIGVFLAHVDSKKFKAKNEKAFSIREDSLFDSGTTLSKDEVKTCRFQFQLPKDCPITEKSGSLYLVCANKSNLFNGGHLELNITPFKLIMDFIQVLEFQHRFKIKSLKNKKDSIEATIAVPTTKDLTSVQKLKILLRMNGEDLETVFQFKLKKAVYGEGGVSTEDVDLNIERVLTKADYEIFGDAFNQEGVSNIVNEIMGKVKVKSFV